VITILAVKKYICQCPTQKEKQLLPFNRISYTKSSLIEIQNELKNYLIIKNNTIKMNTHATKKSHYCPIETGRIGKVDHRSNGKLLFRFLILFLISVLIHTEKLSAFQGNNSFNLVESSPVNGAMNIKSDATITLTFTNEVDLTTNTGVRALRVIGSMGGTIKGNWSGENSSTLEFTPENPFFPGDDIRVEVGSLLLDFVGRSAVPAFVLFKIEDKGEVSGWVKSSIPFPAGIDGPKELKSSDIDGDGDLDLVIASNQDNTIRWMENDGAGSFMEHILNRASNNAISVEALDFDREIIGKVDILAGSSQDDRIRLFRQNENGSFSTSRVYDDMNGLRDFAIGDIDNDGDYDLIITSVSDDKVIALINDGFQVFESTELITSLNNPNSLTLKDINNDGYLDIIITSFNDNKISLLENNKDGTFTTVTLDSRANGPTFSTAEELNTSNETLEILVASFKGNALFYYEYDGTNWEKTIIDADLTNVQVAQVSDLNNDGRLDIVASASTPGKLLTFMNLGFGKFSGREMIIDSTMNTIAHFTLGDFNGDGVNDIVVADVEADSVYLFTTLIKEELQTSVPEYNSINVSVKTPIQFNYNIEINSETVTNESVTIWGNNVGNIEADILAQGSSLFVTPKDDLPEGEAIHVYVSNKVKGVNDAGVAESSISFTTEMKTDARLADLNWTIVPNSQEIVYSDLAIGNGLLVGVYSVNDGEISVSEDGLSWEQVSAPAENLWNAIAFGKDLFVAVGRTGDSRAMYSADGKNWTLATMPGDNEWTEIIFAKGRFVAVSRTGDQRVAYSFDGMNWELGLAPYEGVWEKLSYGNGLFVALGPGVMTSKDGIIWEKRDVSIFPTWRDIQYGNGKFVAIGTSQAGQGANSMTSEDGIIWTPSEVNSSKAFLNLNFFKGTYFAATFTGTERIYTSENGTDWASSANQDSIDWNQVYVYNNKMLSYMSGKGIIMSEEIATATAIEQENELIPSQLQLSQNYPNPFNPSTKIQFGLKHSGKVTLEVFDFLGRKIRTLVNETKSAGHHEISFDASNLSSGVYLYRLQQDSEFIIGKMMLVK
jgi:hypothetical protein